MFRGPGVRSFKIAEKLEEMAESETDVALREHLRLLPVPDASSQFNDRVHAALQQSTPWWRPFWAQAVPVLSGAACSLLVTLALLKMVSAAPAGTPHAAKPVTNAVLAYRTRVRMNELLRSDDLNAGSLNGFGARRKAIHANRTRMATAP